MSTEVVVLAGALVLAGLYITYQHSLIVRYKRTLMMATYALQAAYFNLTSEDYEDDTN